MENHHFKLVKPTRNGHFKSYIEIPTPLKSLVTIINPIVQSPLITIFPLFLMFQITSQLCMKSDWNPIEITTFDRLTSVKPSGRFLHGQFGAEGIQRAVHEGVRGPRPEMAGKTLTKNGKIHRETHLV